MKRPPLLPILPLSLASLFLLSGCVGAPLKVGDEKIEKPLEAVTGRTTTDVKKAASKNSLNLWDVYALAVEHTESLASKYENVEQADPQSRQARASLLPQISLNGSKGWQSSSYVGTSSFTTFSNVPSTSLYLTGSETLLTGLNQVAALQGAEAQRAQSRHLLRQEARNLLLEVARSFYTVLQAEDALQSKGEIQNLTEKILTQEKRWRAIGRSRESDVLATEAQLSQVKGDLENAKNQLVQARESLALLGGVKGGRGDLFASAHPPARSNAAGAHLAGNAPTQ